MKALDDLKGKINKLTADNKKLTDKLKAATEKEKVDRTDITKLQGGQQFLNENQKAAEGKITNLESGVAEQKKNTTQLGTNLALVRGKVDKATTGLGTLKVNVTSNAGSIEDLKTNVDKNGNSITNLATGVQGIRTDISADQKVIKNHTDTLNLVKADLDT